MEGHERGKTYREHTKTVILAVIYDLLVYVVDCNSLVFELEFNELD